jgi:probable F420-dependent oxidoreductase
MPVGKTPCGISIPQSFARSPIDVRHIRALLAKAEPLGYDSVWTQEQIVSDSPIVEPVTLLTYAAGLTSKVRLGCAVIILVIRDPIQLAKSLSSLDQLSNGRLIVGVGIGGAHIPEHLFGVAGGRRGRRFVEELQVMKALWTQDRATFKGEFWNFENVPMEPKPLQRPHPPVWFGAHTEIALKRAVRHGDGWMGAGSSSSADFVSNVQTVRRLLDEAKRDPATFAISKRVYLAIDDNRERAERRLREWFAMRYKNADMAPRVSVWGGVSECLDKLSMLVRAGAQHLLLNPVFDEVEQAEVLASEMMPHL